ncbi:MAG UNVERIFIED_CONTAM: RNA polymerase sigma factor [Planctomycetaceae bacterium]|jgi:hypothetical protein
MPASEADRQLIQRIRSGEALAWQQCIDQYEGRLLAYARAHLQDRSAAEDVVQETLLGFLKALPNYDERTPLESWLFSIAAAASSWMRCGDPDVVQSCRCSRQNPKTVLPGISRGPVARFQHASQQ